MPLLDIKPSKARWREFQSRRSERVRYNLLVVEQCIGGDLAARMKHEEGNQAIHELVRNRIQRSIELKHRLLLDQAFQSAVVLAATQMAHSLRNDGKILFFGNGGSAADAQHLAAEFVGRYLLDRRAFAAIALNVNSSNVTSIANDFGFDLVFSRQVEALGKAGDVAVGISTSGNSLNVARALDTAKSRSIYTIALTGASGGLLKAIADCAICVPSEETPRIQECHILTGHIICEIAEQMLVESLHTETRREFSS